MAVPQVAIVGQPNVGKSSLFNWICGHQIAVVDSTAGVTRDRMKYLLHEQDRYFELIDTGGMGFDDPDELTDDIEHQIQLALVSADLILFVVDGMAGVTPLDIHVADRLRVMQTPKVLVVNKCDSTKTDQDVHEFHKLANAPMVLTSVKGNRNRSELLQAIVKNLPPASDDEGEVDEETELKLAIVGRRNTGKSTFINALAEEDRVIVSEVAGTTRDSIDVRFEMDDKVFVAIDTPGVRRKKSLANDIEFYGLVRAQRSIRRADVVLMFFDSQQTISKVDRQLMEEVALHDKPCIFVVNKWDLAMDAEMTAEKWSEYLIAQFASVRHVPIALITAKESRNIKQVINLAQTIHKQARIRVSTGRLNKLVEAAVHNNPPPVRKNKRPKIFYATQVAIEPPTIVLKCNNPALFDESWKRYLFGVFRERLPFQEVPIRVYFRQKGKNEEEGSW